jgi:hypothetical protein
VLLDVACGLGVETSHRLVVHVGDDEGPEDRAFEGGVAFDLGVTRQVAGGALFVYPASGALEDLCHFGNGESAYGKEVFNILCHGEQNMEDPSTCQMRLRE